MREKRSYGKNDPSRFFRLSPPGLQIAPTEIAHGVAGISPDARYDHPFPPGCSDSAGWRHDVAPDEIVFGRRGCNNVDRSNSGNRGRTPFGTAWPGRPAAREPPRHASPRVLASGARQRQWLRGSLEPAWMSNRTKVAISGTLSLPTPGFLLSAALEAKIYHGRLRCQPITLRSELRPAAKRGITTIKDGRLSPFRTGSRRPPPSEPPSSPYVLDSKLKTNHRSVPEGLAG